jgi:ketosteroid isomerase-like protein
MANATSEVTTDALQRFAEAWNRHDLDALMSFMTEDCVFEASAGPDACGTRYAGREPVRAGFAEVWATFTDAPLGQHASFCIWRQRGVRMDVPGHPGRWLSRGSSWL